MKTSSIKLSISNICWAIHNDAEMYCFLHEQGYHGLEIAPTRLFPVKPYMHLEQAAAFSAMLHDQYGLRISSMQSIWYGKNERLFGDKSEKEELTAYSERAIDFAHALGCPNLVFGCPKNRSSIAGIPTHTAIPFFRHLGEYALEKNTVLSLEPNPVIYGTDFINTTQDAFDYVKTVDSKGFRVNLDFGTIVYNNETLDIVLDSIAYVNHIHISEPSLTAIQARTEHMQLARILGTAGYNKYVSIEMSSANVNLDTVKSTTQYIANLFA